MADTIEKVYCTGDGGNDNLAAALLARGRDNDPATMMAAMNGGMGGGWNNPFAYMMMLGMFRFMYGDGWNNGQNGNVQRAEIQSQIDSLRNQMEDNHNHNWSVVGLNKIYQGATRCVTSETPFCLFIELSKKSALWNLRIYKEVTRQTRIGGRTMKKIIVLRHSSDREEERHQHQESDIIHGLPYEKAAKALMGASGYVAYVAKHGYHFTKQLAIKASEQMKNVDGTSHRWTVDEIRLATNNEIISKGTTLGDILYLANMAYEDFYPKVIKTESDCVQYDIAVASDPDGYEGMAFCRWTADIIGKGVTIDWEKLE